MSDRYNADLELGGEESTDSNLSSSKETKKFDYEDEQEMLANDSASGSTGASSKQTTVIAKRKESRDFKFNPTQIIVYAALAVSALGFGIGVFFLLDAQQQKEFENQFQSSAQEVAHLAETNAKSTFGHFRVLATAITSRALDSEEQDFPNVVIPFFEMKISEVTELTGAEMVIWAPFVESQDRLSFELDWTNREAAVRQDYSVRGWDFDALNAMPREIIECKWCSDGNETRPMYLNVNGFMEDVMADMNYSVDGFSVPVAQYGPHLVNTSLVGFDLYSNHVFKKEIVTSMEYDVPIVSEPLDVDFLLEHIQTNATLQPRSFTLTKVYEDFSPGSKVIGYVVGVVPWESFFKNGDNDPIVIQIQSDCGSNLTRAADGTWEEGLHHNRFYNHLRYQETFFVGGHVLEGQSHHCQFNMVIYPTDEFRFQYQTTEPLIYAALVFALFIFVAIMFCLFNLYMTKMQAKAEEQAARAVAVVNSVFPTQIGQRLIADKNTPFGLDNTRKDKLHAILENNDQKAPKPGTKPLADLFLETTVMFADISGFTAWSSTREPSQVFLLLESLYYQFDRVAQKKGVFKVETIGDCYVAVAGLPTPRADHHIAMACFAQDVMRSMDMMTRKLEVELGPDTSSLGLRIGLHSGPVTAGVLRGERARFQLFGDTVNTAARMESTGREGCIQLSETTAKLLRDAGKSQWITAREDKVIAKGKGVLQTYWLRVNNKTDDCEDTLRDASSSSGQDLLVPFVEESVSHQRNTKLERLVEWNVEILSNLLLKILNHRYATGVKADSARKLKLAEYEISGNNNMLDEVVEVVQFPQLDDETVQVQNQVTELDQKVYIQLHRYITKVQEMYHDNPFHNFEHASHVTMSVMKLLNRIIARPEDTLNIKRFGNSETNDCIFQDPMTQFAVALSALLHDLDHPGVTNNTLVKEKADIAVLYGNKSVAEQNSVALAWALLMEDTFVDLRMAIYCNTEEFLRFRQLMVNTILATDIMDKDLKTLREERWKKAFSVQESYLTEEQHSYARNRKATIVIEHLIQASDIAHTMQHFHIYRRWNQKLFMEMYDAYKAGRTDVNPLDGWYKGELGFFDFYIIPLAKKLEECNAFGVSSHEYLSYAEQNRSEWEAKGQQIVEEYREIVMKQQ
ncbi:PAS domain containing protein [Nitzschia inconspicua]|uniref:PAS domain containing protein n=1 Tax=Nitzschia inconspicua TaxID=303405 RepID=A0A9K3LYD5_9STRA|nr:PAS domain containing protein [Nitzschia inconspicua]